MLDYLIVGAGFAGASCARVLAEAGQRVCVIDRRAHIAGNAFDRIDEHGVLIHEYGPHVFHTNSEKVFAWLSRFTGWRPYEHRVLAQVDGRLVPVPVNRRTINTLYGLDLDEAGAANFLARVREPREIRTSEDAVIASVGRDLCEKIFRGYTRKQWGLDLSQLSASVASRIPARAGDDDRYFTDRFQAMPEHGYTAMFGRMLEHPNIDVRTGTAFEDVDSATDRRATIFTGPIDAYFGYRFGRLAYRSLRFEHEHLPAVTTFQAVATVNYPNEHEYTRITEFRHLTGQSHPGTSIVREYPRADGDPYYPIPSPASEALFERYAALARDERNVHFIGRLAQYRYFNMDQVVGAALAAAGRLLSQIK